MTTSLKLAPLMLIQLLASGAYAQAPNSPINCERVTITSPGEGTTVAPNPQVRGTVMPGNYHGRLWVIVHPVDGDLYYVQGSAAVNPNKPWKLTVQLGEDDSEHSGLQYEVQAFINPDQILMTDKKKPRKLRDWPSAECELTIVNVRRK
jgi:hypothetical protein